MDGSKDGETTSSFNKTKETNRTYVISALTKCGDNTHKPVSYSGRLTLQRKPSSKTTTNQDVTTQENQTPEKRLTLKRRTRTGSITRTKVLSEPNPTHMSAKDIHKTSNTPGKTPSAQKTSTKKLEPTHVESKTVSTPTRRTQFEKLSVKRDVFERLAGKDASRPTSMKHTSVGTHKPPHVSTDPGRSRWGANSEIQIGGLNRHMTPTSQVRRPTTLMSSTLHGGPSASRPASGEPNVPVEAGSRTSALPPEVLKMENSAVTVAVRVRPFCSREKNEKACQVIFMNNQETLVQHPDTKQTHTFTFDFSFCSVDESDADFASQKMVYEKLARPLLERAFEGFNTCLFAYGQTGSGKSYTMMGFGEEAGVIPRFCEELFSRLSKTDTKEVSCHLEMSYFEVYNEKIHDLLVPKDEQNQKKMPLRVREHPVYGPYVADLSTNVVTSYADIQTWLELGNRQRATAATGMNDKSSRSHSVFTLVMTQTKTEFVEEEEHDHCITSRINLVDLAGSERCTSAQTSGDRLREGASINKSLLTLGKVISSLSEQAQSRKKVFTPYRESLLTWLLKESLGGNSKTAMIATLSPAASNMEESLSTLRYAQQARMIINIAKVNEDTNAKLIRELKAEVEKLRSAQMSSQGVEPEKMRLFQQEIAALKNKLSQQERDMAEAHRTWKEKLEEAEKRKREETKELQRAGVTFKVDNRLPNLVNLNEDPQLSEMLLYMIKEGETKVGKLKSVSAHDIQLSGALIADEHCVISNVKGTVSIKPMLNAKTYLNGNIVSECTVLHHGDRVILGGDHYFRFNHPSEVQSGKRVSCWNAGDGQRDFEFAKNELLSAQRAQLEAEIEAARLKAKEEMMQGIQMAEEMAQQELSEQKIQYENRIKALERELEKEGAKKREQEQDKQRAVSQIEQLQTAKTLLEWEVNTHQKRLQVEAQATRQALADHDIRHAKIVEALEAEKRKIAEDLAQIEKKRAQKVNQTPKSAFAGYPQWDAMKLSLMIEEANKISAKLRKHTVFSRHEGNDKENGGGGALLQVQVQNIKLGISTFWSLEKFQGNLAGMRELEQGESSPKDDDVFYNPNDEWEPDLSASSSTSSFSRRRSRSLLKSKRISGRLYEIRVHPIQSLHCGPSQSTGLMGMGKPPSLHSSTSDSALPAICKDLIGASIARLRSCQSADEDESLADKLTLDLLAIHGAVRSISDLYDHLDDDSRENLFACNTEAQTHLVKATSAVERAVFVTVHWVSNIKPSSTAVSQTAEELKAEVKKIGGYLQLLIQGCDSEISSMVTEAQRKVTKCLNTALSTIGLLAAVSGTDLHLTELCSEVIGSRSILDFLQDGMHQGVTALLDAGLSITKLMLQDAQIVQPRTQILQSLKNRMVEVALALQSYIHCSLSERSDSTETCTKNNEDSDTYGLQNTASKLLKLNQALTDLHSSLSSSLKGRGSDAGISSFRQAVQTSSKTIDDVINGLPRQMGGGRADSLRLPCVKRAMAARNDVQSALHALTGAWDRSTDEMHSLDEDDRFTIAEMQDSGYDNRNRTVPKVVYSLSSGISTCSRDARWV
ncbi:kinesin-like protein KIF14 [Triplophysa rosa]|uniref:kinesin-like protein KIF14 n=1 Tax=Triplophysa rosa TaxID=992332 RepID=UPI00254623D7|nr:kinesin-like protein KIF14 [Triplophysa rosa]XP_057180879.1 kinesin-like protein KIF14 [Triplophysa rosa]